MKPCLAILILASSTSTWAATDEIETKNASEDYNLNFTEIVTKYGYDSQELNVITEDGYITKMFRMSSPNCSQLKAPPVLLVHGLIESSDLFLDAGPGKGLAYLIADDCFNLWLSNVRGNYYGREHKRLNPDKDDAFWEFSVDEMGKYDLPAQINLVLNETGFENLNVVTYSQGGGMFYIMCSERQDMCDKVNVHVSLAPATRIQHTKSLLFRLLAAGETILSPITTLAKHGEVLNRGSVLQSSFSTICKQRDILSVPTTVCDGFLSLLDSFDGEVLSEYTRKILFAHFPAGTSARNMIRYTQSLNIKYFQKYDFGSEKKNLEKYGVKTPPKYNISMTTTPVALFWGLNDHLVDSIDINWLKDQLPNLLEYYIIEDPKWNHLDYPYSQRNPELVYPKVRHYLELYTNNN